MPVANPGWANLPNDRAVRWDSRTPIEFQCEIHLMLTCLPRSICSWNFLVRGTMGGEAGLTFNWFTEQGTIDWNGTEYEVVKHGPFSGHWTLEIPGRVVMNAQKSSAFTRTFELDGSCGPLTLQARSMLTREFEIFDAEKLVGTIVPMHMFTRRAKIFTEARVDCDSKLSELAQLFAFWLVALTWKRATKSDNSNR